MKLRNRYILIFICVNLIMFFCSCASNYDRENSKTAENTIKIFNRSINISNDNKPINSTVITKEELKGYFLLFYERMSLSSVRFNNNEFFKYPIKITQLRKIDDKIEKIYYYSKYTTEDNDKAFIVFDKEFNPLEIIDCNDSIFSDSEKKDVNYNQRKKDIMLKGIILNIDL